MVAMSPRNPPPRLRSTTAETGEGTPRRASSHYERIALRRGYTIKAGKKTRNRVAESDTTKVRTKRGIDNDPVDRSLDSPSA